MQSLFNHSEENLLPKHGEVFYFESFISAQETGFYKDFLMKEIAWKPDELMMFGKKITTKREVAWYGDAGMNYKYSGISRSPLEWLPPLSELKIRLEAQCNHNFNSCLLNLYNDGSEGMSWHSDDEPELGPEPVIASVSFGAERKFSFKNKKTGETRSILLGNGSLLLMKGKTQQEWVHALPKSKLVRGPRVNLTFRSILSKVR